MSETPMQVNASHGTSRLAPWLTVLALVGLALPPLAYWLVIGRAPGMSPREAKRMLTEPGTKATLVDIRAMEAFARAHPEGAVNVPWEWMQAFKSPGDLPENLRGRTLLLLCSSGILAADAALHLRAIGVADARKIDNGLDGWIADEAGASGAAPVPCRLFSNTSERCNASRPTPLYAQWASIITGFIVKPAYMLLSLLLIVVLWRSSAPDLVALRRSMAAFLAGEGFCAVNFLAFGDQSHLSEFLHSYGMVLAFGLAAYALAAGIDRRILRFTDPGRRCLAGGLCESCIKQADAPCGMKRVFLLLVPCVALLGLIPMTTEPQMVSYNTVILESPYNWSHAAVYQIFETRFCPMYGAVLMAMAFALLLRPGLRGVATAKALFAAGLGPIGFGFFRFTLFGSFRDDLLWFAFWEEITEMLFVAGVAWVIWVFRRKLFSEERSVEASAPSPEDGPRVQ